MNDELNNLNWSFILNLFEDIKLIMTHSSFNHHINFRQVQESDCSIVLEWLNNPSLNKWRNGNLQHMSETIYQKDHHGILGYIKCKEKKIPIESYIICLDECSIGYVQLYHFYDLNVDDDSLISLIPYNTGVINFYIDEKASLDKEVSLEILKKFLNEYAFTKFQYIYVSPKIENEKSIRFFQKLGFLVIKKQNNYFIMLALRPNVRLSVKDAIEFEKAFKIAFLPQDQLFIFGSRVEMNKSGGDIDLYIETHAKTVEDAMKRKNIFLNELFKHIEDQKIDIVINVLNLGHDLPIYRIAKKEGILMC